MPVEQWMCSLSTQKYLFSYYLFQTVSLFRFYCFPLDPSVCFLKYHSVAKATIAFWQQFHLYENSRNLVLIVPVRLPHSYRWCWGRDCIIGLGTLMSRHNPLIGVTWFRCEGEGSGTQGRERKTLENVLIGFCGHLYCVIIFLKYTCMLLMTQRNILLPSFCSGNFSTMSQIFLLQFSLVIK